MQKPFHALKSILNDEYLSRVSNIESTFVLWNTLLTFGEQTPNEKESDSDDGSDASNMCYMVLGDDPLEVNSESKVDGDVDMPHDELAMFY